MYSPHQGGNRFGRQGAKKFQSKGGWGQGSAGRDVGRSSMHAAICHSCGQTCEVPFRPNGKKPVYCTVCFKKEDSPFESRRFNDSGAPRPALHEQREVRPMRNNVSEQRNAEQWKEQFVAIHVKLDAITRLLSSQSSALVAMEGSSMNEGIAVEHIAVETEKPKKKKVIKKRQEETV